MSEAVTAITIPLDQLLASKCLSRTIFLFDHEVSQHSQADFGGDTEAVKLRRHLNATKVSLLLVKAVYALTSENTSTFKDCGLASLQLTDYHVKVEIPQGLLEKRGGLFTEDDAKNMLHECSDGEHLVLVEVEIMPREIETGACAGHGVGFDQGQSHMPNVGMLIQSIFSDGSPESLRIFAAHSGKVGGDDDNAKESDDRQPVFKSSRNNQGKSLFSSLLDTGGYPVSVCRLLSDMVRDSNNTIVSFDEVIDDLGQMSNNPQFFLHDQGNDFYSSNLHFGQGHYGRVGETTKLLEISNRINENIVGAEEDQNQEGRPSTPPSGKMVDAVFVRGVAGSGKSHFALFCSNFLQNLGWVVLRVKFKRSLEYESRAIFLSLFEKMVDYLVSMRDGGNALDADYSRRAARALSDAFDPASLSSLANFIPSIQELFPEIDRSASLLVEAEMSHWQLVFLLSKLISAILSLDRHIMICLDDLQWCDQNTCGLITEMLISVSQSTNRGRQNLLTVGIYRDDEIAESHSIASQITVLKKSINVEVNEIKLPCLSRDDITDMIMSEMRLPRRLVDGLAGIVHKKTSGHAMSVVQLLNSLVRDSSIVYSPHKHRFDWDENKITTRRMPDSVASLIVSNLSFIKPKSLQSLRIISCFGIQSELTLLKLLGSSHLAPKGGIESSLPGLVERGVLELRGSYVTFTHDLIQQRVYEDIPVEVRRQLHLDIGIFLGCMTTLDASSQKASIEGGVGHLDLSDGSSAAESIAKPSMLTSIAIDQVNAAGPRFILDRAQQARFAGWNYHAGKEAAEHSNFQAALYNHENGIAFLADRLWLDDATYKLCRELHEGAAFASFALGNETDVEKYSQAIIDHVPFEDSLVAQDLHIRSLKGAGKYSECTARGIAVLRLLKIDIPSAPTPVTVIQAMKETGKIASKYTSDQITNMKQTSINARKRRILKIVDAVIVACYREASPFLPLVACVMVNFSMQNGVCEESAAAFVVFGYFQIFLGENFGEGRRWGDIASTIMDSNSAFTPMTVYGFLLFWFLPHREVASILRNTHEAGMKIGDVDGAMYALCLSLRFSFFGGEKLSLLSRSYKKSFKHMAKYSPECLKFTVVDSLLVGDLSGCDNDPFSAFEGTVQNEDTLLADAKHKNHNQGLEAIYTRRFFSSFWKGNYTDACKWFDLGSLLPSSKMPKIQLIYHTFYYGLMSYQLYKDGDGEEWLDKGKEVLEKMGRWVKNCKLIFESKLYLLEAEHYASMCNIVAAKESYELSAKSARDHGLVHEQGLAFEYMGKFLSTIVDPDTHVWFHRAHACYMQWGAIAKAEQLQKEHSLVLDDSSRVVGLGSSKHGRDEVDENLISYC